MPRRRARPVVSPPETDAESSVQEESDHAEDVDSSPTMEELLRAIASGMRAPTDQTFGRFGRCCTGAETGPQLDGFLDALTSFKEQQGISDENALKQLSQVLGETALTWWMTVGRTSRTWTEALEALRETF